MRPSKPGFTVDQFGRMKNKQLLYESVKTVLTYMEPNFRFNLALKIPSIRKAEKAAPLHIDCLKLEDDRVVVNETEYKISLYLQCERGHLNYDINERGDPINVDETIRPGDIKLGDLGSWDPRRCGVYGCPKSWREESFQDDCPPEKKYAIFCNHCILLYVSGSMSHFPYRNMKMYQLMKRLLKIFFGNRSGEWTIKNMSLPNNVLRWPVATRKPIVESINIGNYSQLKINSLDSIIDSTVPLTNLEMSVVVYHDRIVDHPLLLHADHVTISNQSLGVDLSDYFTFQAHTVIIANPPTTYFYDFERVIIVFMKKTRPIGVRWSILTQAKKDLTTLNLPNVLEISREFNLALKIPSIRKAEKAAPLHINRLKLEDDSFNRDIDENGDPINIDETIQPGDIKLDDLRSMDQKGWGLYGCPKKWRRELFQLDYPQETMYSLFCNHSIRLYVSGSMYELPYTNMKMCQLMKGLLTTFFGNRIGEWTVKKMSLQNSVLRWPVATRKPIVQSVNIGNYSQLKMNGLDAIIDSSVPLTNLKMSIAHSPDRIVDHPLLMHADQLTISGNPPGSFLSDLFSIKTHNVSITSAISTSIETLIDLWMEKTRPIGVRYKIFTRYKTNLELIRHPEVFERSTNCIKLAMGSDAMVVFQFSRIHFDTWFYIETCPRNV
ncbi:hypothetical protein B9Z55_000199 [Caenorhabditis nigoni]|uniref:Uncharacterized protein n=2 Tax=Caenorhabditis nigoni TaxID=1611254 RepID=A0A2G5VID5_9PELO|nr:hypothetical protein B9Z55_000199 [Caenorhabditis nigoni]